LGLTWGQLGVICGVVAMMLILLWTIHPGPAGLAAMLLPAAVLFGLGVGRYRRESLLLICWQMIRFALRAITGQTQFRRDVWLRVASVSAELGQARVDGATPQATTRFVLPGALGDIQLLQIPGRGGFAYNPRDALATVTVAVGSRAWSLRDVGAQESAYDGFVEWLSSLENLPGLVEAVTRIRIDRASTNEMLDYLRTREDEHSPQVSPELKREYFKAISAGSKRSMGFSNLVSLTFDTNRVSRAIHDAGGGLLGLGKVLTGKIAGIETAMERVGVSLEQWLDADGLDATLAAASDPVSSAVRRQRESGGRRAAQQNMPMMGVDEGWSYLRVDESWHHTYWVAEWPRTEVRTGFLEPLLYAGDSTRVVTLQMRPVPTHKALAEVERAQADMESAAQIRTRLRSHTSVQHDREAEALHEREIDLVDGFGVAEFRGFVTVSAESEDALATARTVIEEASHAARVNLASMHGQQAAAFVTSALPVPVKGR
jgi:hypothetical protein